MDRAGKKSETPGVSLRPAGVDSERPAGRPLGLLAGVDSDFGRFPWPGNVGREKGDKVIKKERNMAI